jgi:hypothetical protein
VNLYVWPGDGHNGRTTTEGFTIDEWNDGGLHFAAVSDIGPGELDQFKASFRSAAYGPAPR